ncbi:hypothetical protein [Caulobacter segnis]|uniref:hypothetical protein n=1 Tax=Caulobacter segnis TaxID=88688 RepID=UPI001CBC3A25|nr:hypothetical protein [Caulobacter segnis]UAL10180.1 hypothetical protein K8940_20820 [Caulobacter segnis]
MSDIVPNERTALAQNVIPQPDGPGLRIEKRGEATVIGKVLPGGAELFRQRLPQFQAEAAYWEGRVGTVHDLRITLFDNDTRLLFAVTFDGDFKPYIADILREAGPWFDSLLVGIWEGYTSSQDQETIETILANLFGADFFYVSNPELTVRDITRLKKLGSAFSEMLDAAN